MRYEIYCLTIINVNIIIIHHFFLWSYTICIRSIDALQL